MECWRFRIEVLHQSASGYAIIESMFNAGQDQTTAEVRGTTKSADTAELLSARVLGHAKIFRWIGELGRWDTLAVHRCIRQAEWWGILKSYLVLYFAMFY